MTKAGDQLANNSVSCCEQAPTFVDLFAGCGGLSLGLLSAGWKGLFAVERDKMAFETLCANLVERQDGPRFDWIDEFPKKPQSIGKVLSKHRKVLADLRHRVDLVAGGPPCQGFSFAGRRKPGDPRNRLLWQYKEFVSIVQPKLVLIENVRGMAVSHGGKREPFSQRLLCSLRELGYYCFAEIHRASEFGVPQERPRYIVIGVKSGQFTGDAVRWLAGVFPHLIKNVRLEFLQAKGLRPGKCITPREALSDLEVAPRSLEPSADAPRRLQIRYDRPRTKYQILLHGDARAMDSMRLAQHQPKTVKKFRKLIDYCKTNGRTGVSLNDKERRLLRNKKHAVTVLNASQPSHTLTTLPDDLLHYAEPRILTVREYARLQSFPDWFVFRGKYTTGGKSRVKECPRYTQVGNAVAPFVAEALGMLLSRILDDLGEYIRPQNKRTAPPDGFAEVAEGENADALAIE